MNTKWMDLMFSDYPQQFDIVDFLISASLVEHFFLDVYDKGAIFADKMSLQ